jgi:hypothetical protein
MFFKISNKPNKTTFNFIGSFIIFFSLLVVASNLTSSFTFALDLPSAMTLEKKIESFNQDISKQTTSKLKSKKIDEIKSWLDEQFLKFSTASLAPNAPEQITLVELSLYETLVTDNATRIKRVLRIPKRHCPNIETTLRLEADPKSFEENPDRPIQELNWALRSAIQTYRALCGERL